MHYVIIGSKHELTLYFDINYILVKLSSKSNSAIIFSLGYVH